MQLNSR